MRILTIDLEDWFHLLEWEGADQPALWDGFESRVEASTDWILQILAGRGVLATFFCLGWIAERHPTLVRRIHGLGHEIASHGYGHQLLPRMTRRGFREDITRSTRLLADLIGERVGAYRAPGFSLGPSSAWALDTLLEQGIEVDASVFPARRAHGGFLGGSMRPCWLAWSGGRLRELPVAPAVLLGTPVPFSGGGYFRALPYALVRHLLRRAPYAMTYFHPRDFDCGQPRARGLGAARSIRSYVGIASARRRFPQLLDDFDFTTVREAVARIDWRDAPIDRIDGTFPRGGLVRQAAEGR